MVYAFIIQSVHSTFCQVLHSQFFSDESISDPLVAGSREDRKEALQLVAQRVAIEYDFLRRQQLTGRSSDRWEEEHPAMALDGQLLPDLETGMFTLDPSIQPHFGRRKVVLWCAALTTGFVLVLEADENRVLAHAALKLLVKHLQDGVQVLTNPGEVLLRPDAVLSIVRRMLPDGQLLFLNSRAVKRMEREMEKRD